MRKLQILIIIAFCFVILTACAQSKKNEEVEIEGVEGEIIISDVSGKDNNEKEIGKEDENQEEIISAKEKIEVRIGALKGATAIGMVQVMDKASREETANNYKFTIAGTADEISTALIKGELDIAAVPCNLAAVLYNKTGGKIQLAGINTLGVLYIVETGNAIQSVEDLRGKTIYSTGYGTTPQYTLNYMLKSYGIDPEKDVTIEYKTEATEVGVILNNSNDAIAMLPQPYVTTVMMTNDKVRIALNIADEWDSISTDGSSVVTGVVVIRKEFLENNKAAVDSFLEENKISAAFVNENIEDAAALVENFDIFKAVVAKKAIPYCNITFLQGETMKEKVNGYLSTLFLQNPKSVGGQMPTDEFYYIP